MLALTPDQACLAPPLVTEAAGQNYRQTTQFLYLSGVIHKSADLSLEIEQRFRLMWACLKWFATAPLSLNVRMLKAEVIETLLYGCVTFLRNRQYVHSLLSQCFVSCGSTNYTA